MSRPQLCPSCQLGKHDQHDRDWNIRPGLIGGAFCPCRGDCVDEPHQSAQMTLVSAPWHDASRRQTMSDWIDEQSQYRWTQAERDAAVAQAAKAGITVTWKKSTLVELERECFAPIEDAIAEAERRAEEAHRRIHERR